MKKQVLLFILGLLLPSTLLPGYDLRLLFNSAELGFGMFPSDQAGHVYLSITPAADPLGVVPVLDSSTSIFLGSYTFSAGLIVGPKPFSLGLLAPHFNDMVNDYVKLSILSMGTTVSIQKSESAWLSSAVSGGDSEPSSPTFRIDQVKVGTYLPGPSMVDYIDMTVSLPSIPEPAVTAAFGAFMALVYAGIRKYASKANRGRGACSGA